MKMGHLVEALDEFSPPANSQVEGEGTKKEEEKIFKPQPPPNADALNRKDEQLISLITQMKDAKTNRPLTTSGETASDESTKEEPEN